MAKIWDSSAWAPLGLKHWAEEGTPPPRVTKLPLSPFRGLRCLGEGVTVSPRLDASTPSPDSSRRPFLRPAARAMGARGSPESDPEGLTLEAAWETVLHTSRWGGTPKVTPPASTPPAARTPHLALGRRVDGLGK